MQVARRIEEVSTEEATPSFARPTLRDGPQRDAAGVGRQDGVGGGEVEHAGPEVALDFEALGDGLNDPVAGSQSGQVVIEVAYGDQRRSLGGIERGGLAFDGRIQTALGRGVGEVQQEYRDLRIGKVSGDSRAHGTGAENGHLLDRSDRELGHSLIQDTRTVEVPCGYPLS